LPIFSVSPTSGSAPLAVTFFHHEGLESGNFSVNFGDGEDTNISIRKAGSLTHTYAYAGTYTATLIKNLTKCNPDADFGCDMTKEVGTVTITVAGRMAPSASLIAMPRSGGAPLTVKFSGSVWGTGYEFSTGDGLPGPAGQVCSGSCTNVTIPVDQTYTYFVPGKYIAKLKSRNNQSTVTVNVTGTIPNNGFITITSGGPGYIKFIVVGRGSYTIDTGESKIHKDRIIDLSGPLQHKDPPLREVMYYYSSSGTRTAKLYQGHPCTLDTSCTQSLPMPIATQTITVPGLSSGIIISGGSDSPECTIATAKFLKGEITPKAWHAACGSTAIYNGN
jgi:PKD repeat protein